LKISLETLATVQSLRKRFCNEEGLLVKANPSMQIAVCKNVDSAYFGNYPTLIDLNNAFNWNTAVKWLVPQLFDLSEYCGCKSKLSESQMEQCASTIANFYGYLKISEFMLFFQRFKAAKYGRFYGSVDPMIITSALMEFVKERNDIYSRHLAMEAEKRRQEEQEGCVTWEDWKTQHKVQAIRWGQQ